jgi:hypothetical protein
MVMAPPLRHAVTHEAQTQRRGLSLAAAAAAPTGGERGARGSTGEFLRCAVRRDVGGSVGRYDGGAVVCPCPQWSSGHPRSGTLVRHVMCVVAPAGDGSTALAPAPRPLRVSHAPVPRALVTLRGLAPRIFPGQAPARPAAVAVAAVAAAAKNDLGAATRTQV